MADNLTAPVATGIVLATDDIGGTHYPRTKISIGADGSAADLSATNPLPSYDTVSGPARSARTVTPSDTVALAVPAKSLLVVSGGTVALRAIGDTADEIYPDLPPYALLPIQVSHIRATGTTATHIKSLV